MLNGLAVMVNAVFLSARLPGPVFVVVASLSGLASLAGVAFLVAAFVGFRRVTRDRRAFLAADLSVVPS